MTGSGLSCEAYEAAMTREQWTVGRSEQSLGIIHTQALRSRRSKLVATITSP